MTVYTSYFNNHRVYNTFEWEEMYSVARYPPSSFDGDVETLYFLFPSQGTLSLWHNEWKSQSLFGEFCFTYTYLKQLMSLTVDQLEILSKVINSDKDIVLLCFEVKGKFCHRQLIANFIRMKYNILVREF